MNPNSHLLRLSVYSPVYFLFSTSTFASYLDFFPIFPFWFLFFISLLSFLFSPSLPVALGRNQPLKRERPKWKSDYPMTEGQLRSKRDEFWDTAPAFEGRKEIWDALRAAASAFESNDHLLAQAILDGASITLPHGNTHLYSGGCSTYCVLYSPWNTLGGLYVGHCSWWLPPQEFQLPPPKFSRETQTPL